MPYSSWTTCLAAPPSGLDSSVLEFVLLQMFNLSMDSYSWRQMFYGSYIFGIASSASSSVSPVFCVAAGEAASLSGAGDDAGRRLRWVPAHTLRARPPANGGARAPLRAAVRLRAALHPRARHRPQARRLCPTPWILNIREHSFMTCFDGVCGED